MHCSAEGEVDGAGGGEPNDEENGGRSDDVLAVAVVDPHRHPDELVSEKSGRGTKEQGVEDGLHFARARGWRNPWPVFPMLTKLICLPSSIPARMAGMRVAG